VAILPKTGLCVAFSGQNLWKLQEKVARNCRLLAISNLNLFTQVFSSFIMVVSNILVVASLMFLNVFINAICRE
jgi:hypothetical protein